MDAWLESPSVVLLAEPDGHWPRLRATLAVGRATGPMVHDARVAALCAAYEVSELWTADRDFGRFPGGAGPEPARRWMRQAGRRPLHRRTLSPGGGEGSRPAGDYSPICLKKSFPLSSTRMKAGKFSTSIFQTASIPSSGKSRTSTFLMFSSARTAAGPPGEPR